MNLMADGAVTAALEDWLAGFNAALAAGNVEKLATLFEAES
ncbi:hypothetical protein NUH88_06480 [Nisaea acidiphila]|uniref:SnoaL-like domain-containing protein n=1 Tax=Nisaea acidiphila TaxID=1862145 RepID=A0A9J7AY27_9PROT|nr:hypothetical protein [Nisaea acidiphila]UUX51337.1 hypothetical protein NUH88_06480 [Nisaea acidiphila]